MQLPLSLPLLQDCSAVHAGRPRLPATRAECEAGKVEREAGKDCPHVLCRHHLLGELARRPDSEGVAALVARAEGQWSGSCALDIADEGGVGEAQLAAILGVDRGRLAQMVYEAGSRMRRRLAQDGLRP